MTGQAPPAAVLLGTCAVIRLVNGKPLPAGARAAIASCTISDTVHVSTTTALEFGLLSWPRRQRPPFAPQFLPDAKAWFATLLAKPGIREAPITAAIATDASHLPGDLHPDPMDRLPR